MIKINTANILSHYNDYSGNTMKHYHFHPNVHLLSVMTPSMVALHFPLLHCDAGISVKRFGVLELGIFGQPDEILAQDDCVLTVCVVLQTTDLGSLM